MIAPPLECTTSLPQRAPCEHIAGNEKFVLKAFEAQQRHIGAHGRSLVDVTLDLEDGAPVGSEDPLRHLFVNLLTSNHNVCRQVGVRVHPVDSEHFWRDLQVLLEGAAEYISYVTIPKVRSVRDVRWTLGLIEHAKAKRAPHHRIALHLLIETPEALASLPDLAAIPEVETLDFGLMDYISQLGGAIPASCMRSPGQFDHHLLRSAKTTITQAALAANKIPSHNVTVDVRDPERAYHDAFKARHEFGFLRMWSIHPGQIEPIIRGMTPSQDEIAEAKEIIDAAQAASWGPIEVKGRLHDRASYRYYWGVLSQSGNV